jgi:hypothetical protein
MTFASFVFDFASFEKGGHGGFALDPAVQKQSQRQIPLSPPFSKGEEQLTESFS